MSDAFGCLDLFSAFSSKDNVYEDSHHDNGVEELGPEAAAELSSLRSENAKLKSRIRLYERFSHLFPSQTPLAEVDYFKSPLSIECQARIESELYTVLSENRDTADENDPKNEYDSHGHVLYMPYYIIDSVGKYWEKTPVQYGDNTPLFTAVYSVALDDRQDRLDMFGAKLPKDNSSSGPECFNCGGAHRLSDCKEPHDKKRIQDNLKLFKEARGGPNHNDRYHVRVVKEIEQKFKDLEPGKMSEALQTALGLENHELPPHVYRMRNFGYPPGYSLDPPLSTSRGMEFYYKPLAGASKEEGELEEKPRPCVVDYPGYTTDLPSDVIDKFSPKNPVYSAVTPTLSDKRKGHVVSHNKRRKVEQPLGGRKEEDDMDIEQENEPAPAYSRAIIHQPPMPSAPPPPPGTPPPLPTTPALLLVPTASSTPVPDKTGDPPEKESQLEEGEEVKPFIPDEEETTPAVDEPEPEPPKLNRSIVSESNKIGIKFNTTDDYGPLDQRAGNFTKLQCILRSRKKSTPRNTPTRSNRRNKK